MAQHVHANVEGIEKGIIAETIVYVQKIIGYVRPTAELFVAIDGPPPRAKMAQQRKRRFVGAWREDLLEQSRRGAGSHGGGGQPQWDRNAITPGTAFMAVLSASLRTFLADWHRAHPEVRVTFLDSDSPGEGEAKIYHHLKAERGGADPAGAGGADVVYGLDADLIMLSLIAHADGASRPIYLLREPAEFSGGQQKTRGGQHHRMPPPPPFMYFDTGALATVLASQLNIPVRDYVVLCFLLGNDFLPPLSYLKINNDGIDTLITHYRQVRGQFFSNGETLVVEQQDNVLLNYPFLLALVDRLKNEEDRGLAEADATYYDFVPRQRFPATHQVALKDPALMSAWLDNYPSVHKFPRSLVRPNTMGWRPRYYFHMFNGMTEGKDVDGVCANYLEGIQWTFDYYFSFDAGATAWGWYYKHEYSPTALDLYNHLATRLATAPDHARLRDSLRAETRDPARYDPFDPTAADATRLQLLMVLPPSSFHLLPDALRTVASDVALGCAHMYPTGFSLTSYLKKFLWECHPVLPLVDMDRLTRTMRECKEKNQFKNST